MILNEIVKELVRISNENNKHHDMVYIYDNYNDVYYTVEDIRIDSENDIVIDIE